MSMRILDVMHRLRPGAPLDWFLSWPADLFALTTSILRDSDAYRLVLSVPPSRRWPPTRWREEVTTRAGQWVEQLAPVTEEAGSILSVDWQVSDRPTSLADFAATLERCQEMDLQQLNNDEDDAWDALTALVTLNAIADDAGAYLPHAPFADTAAASSRRAIFDCGRFLLLGGSLSRIATSNCRVLPKAVSRTPGVTVRGLSRHLSLCGPSVDIAWRYVDTSLRNVERSRLGAGPEARGTVNILLLPWPERIEASDFRAVADDAQPAMNRERFGYFSYWPKGRLRGAELEASLKQILAAARFEGDPVDMLVLPEMALDDGAVSHLRSAARAHQVGLAVAGMQSRAGAEGSNECIFSAFPHQGDNDEMQWGRQGKHHRWFLDSPQVAQYQLGSVLKRRVTWWERIRIERRRQLVLHTSVMLGNMVIAPLICEDLARQEPIGDLLRTLAPTLVLALLLDGPQLKSRWPGHYACVLADDPGSSVLTLTALGMVARCHADGYPRSRTIALWKDTKGNFREIEIAPEAQGVMLKLRIVEETACLTDGREYPRAQVLRLDQVVQVHPLPS